MKRIFGNERKLAEWLIRYDSIGLMCAMPHERAHFETAKSLDYSPKYIAEVKKKRGGFFTSSIKVAIRKKVRLEDLRKIALAPLDPSKEDILAFCETCPLLSDSYEDIYAKLDGIKGAKR